MNYENSISTPGSYVKEERYIEKCLNCNASNLNQGQIINDWQGNRYNICTSCKCWIQNPQKDIMYENTYWGIIKDPDGNIRDLTKERESRLKNWYCETIPFVNSLPPGQILDVGAGLGFFLSAIDPNWQKHASDVSEKSLDFIANNQPEVKTKLGTLEECNFENSMFDVVIAYHVIEHVPNPHKFLNEISRILKPNGKLILGTPNIGSIAAKWFRGNFRLLGNGHLCLYNETAIVEACKKSGFKTFDIKKPFWKTDYANLKQLYRMIDNSKLSPAFWGNVMNIYCEKF